MYNVNEKRKHVINMLLSAGLAGIVFIIFCIISGIRPFGDGTILRNDAIHQYAPFLAQFVESLKSGESLQFSWQLGAGTNEFATICYYLLSPFNLIALPFDNTNIDIAMVVIILLKLMCIASTMTLFLSKKFDCAGLTISAFSVLYTFCGFIIAFYYNTMWLDAMIVLPLIALGIENIVKGKKSTLYFLSLTYIILVNFYMAFMLCIFAVLYLIILIFSQDITSKKEKSSNILDPDKKEPPIGSVLLKFGISSLFAGLISAVVIIPVIFSITNSAAKNDFEMHGLLFNVMDFLSFHFSGINVGKLEMTQDTGPYVMCSMLTVILVPLYFSIKSIKINEKIINGIALLVFFLSFQIPKLNFLWHGMNKPAGLPYRFSYIYCFLLIILAFKTFIKLKEVPTWAFIIPGVIIIATLIYMPHSEFSAHFDINTYIISAVAAAVFIIQLLLLKKGFVDRKMASLLLTICILVELIAGNYNNIYVFEKKYDKVYPDVEKVEQVNEYINKKSESKFTRMELAQSDDIRNLPAIYGYNGISTFSSLTDSVFSITQSYLGNKGNLFNSYKYTTQTPIYNSMFAMNYVFDVNDLIPESSPYYEKVGTFSGKKLYKVKYALPLGYCVNSDISKWDPYNFNSNNVQFKLFEMATGVSNVFDFIKEDNVDYINSNAVSFSEISKYAETNNESTTNQTNQSESHDEHAHSHDELMDNAPVDENSVVTDFGDFNKETLGNMIESIGEVFPFKATGEKFGVEFTFTAKKDGEVFMLAASGSLRTLSVVNSDGSSKEYNVDEKGICDIGYYKAGETFKATVSNPDRPLSEFNEEYPITDSVQMSVATLDNEQFVKGYNNILNNGVLEIESFENNHITGKVNASKDGVMMMAMPCDEGWTVYVDGVETELVEHESHIMMYKVDKGEHEIEMKYFPQGLKGGLFVSIASLVALALVLLLNKVHAMKAEVEIANGEDNDTASFANNNDNEKKEE